VKGSHGNINNSQTFHPVIITGAALEKTLKATEVHQVIWEQLIE
jgi:hypothetical protein